MYDPSDPNVYVVLDEGFNSTCHGRKWAEIAANLPLIIAADVLPLLPPFTATDSPSGGGDH